MTNRLELRHRYPEPPDRMREVLTDADFLRAKLRAVGGPRAELVSREEDERGITVVLRQTVPASALPSFVRAVMNGDLVIHRIETWTSSAGSVQAEVDGAPGTIGGQMRLEPDRAGSVLTLRLEATVRLPLIGGKVEKNITDSVGKLMDAEYDFTLNWLRESTTS
ncbi:MAG: DUF2505 domain-containing protein [Pseudonocardiaceae bacterium]